LIDPRIDRLARLVVEYCVSAGRGDEVVINAGIEAYPLVREIVKYLVLNGAYPLLINLSEESITEVFYKYATREVLEYVSDFEKLLMERVSVSISIVSPSHTKALNTVDPERIMIRSRARAILTKIFMERSARGELRWNVTAFPTKALAQEAGMSYLDFVDFVFHATYADTEDPISRWREIAAEQERIASFLNKVSELRFTGPGIDLYMRVDGRKWINDDGKNNMPGGEVFTAPIEDSVEGWVKFDYPALWRGVEVEGVKLVFKRGEVIEAYA